jgi:hypothetical protein
MIDVHDCYLHLRGLDASEDSGDLHVAGGGLEFWPVAQGIEQQFALHLIGIGDKYTDGTGLRRVAIS